jgi:hypothetical protein
MKKEKAIQWMFAASFALFILATVIRTIIENN